MDDDARRALRAELKGAVPKGLDALSDEEADSLAKAIQKAKRSQSAALDNATRRALTHVPKLLRPVIKRIVLG